MDDRTGALWETAVSDGYAEAGRAYVAAMGMEAGSHASKRSVGLARVREIGLARTEAVADAAIAQWADSQRRAS